MHLGAPPGTVGAPAGTVEFLPTHVGGPPMPGGNPHGTVGGLPPHIGAPARPGDPGQFLRSAFPALRFLNGVLKTPAIDPCGIRLSQSPFTLITDRSINTTVVRRAKQGASCLVKVQL